MNAVDLLLRIDHLTTANSIGLKEEHPSQLLTEENLYKIINHIEILSLDSGNEKKISSICGLLWTHFGSRFDLLGQYIYSTMSRIGFAPVRSMLKEGSNAINGSSILTSLETELNSAAQSITALGKTYSLTGFQKELWNAIEASSNIAVSAPTSAGKSFLICLNVISGIKKRGGISVYIVPTLTLMNQVASDLTRIANEHCIDVQIKTHIPKNSLPKKAAIYIATQERASEIAQKLSSQEEININFLIIDEIQNIERAFDYTSNDVRSKLLLDVIIDTHDKLKPKKTIISGPRISEITSLSEALFKKHCHAVIAKSSPVANICYSINPHPKSKDKIVLRQYSELTSKHAELPYENTINANGFGKKLYPESFHNYTFTILLNNPGSLLFSPTAIQSRKSAKFIAERLQESDSRELTSLSDYIAQTVSPRYDLIQCVMKGVAFHHGKMPHHIRNAVEFAVNKSLFNYVACTTTLMQGVNIPAKNVILRNPNLFVKPMNATSKPVLSNYEIANLRGRAGRLLRDFVGRTFILDGTSFEERDAQQGLFEATQKSIEGSYATVFKENREEIIHTAISGDTSEGRNSISTYISNLIYSEQEAPAALQRRGIHLTQREISAIKSSLKSISVPNEICRQHRYWSPFDLDLLYKNIKHFPLPGNVFSANAKDKLETCLIQMRTLLPHQCETYLGKRNASAKLWLLAKLAVNWAKETPLAKILQDPYTANDADKTDETINLLQNTISYGIPALLSPIHSMIDPEGSFLSSIESGAHKTTTIELINNNIPRETAISVTALLERQRTPAESFHEILIYLQKHKLGFWDAIQFRHSIPFTKLL